MQSTNRFSFEAWSSFQAQVNPDLEMGITFVVGIHVQIPVNLDF